MFTICKLIVEINSNKQNTSRFKEVLKWKILEAILNFL